MQYDINAIPQEEKDKLLYELLKRYENDVQTPALKAAEMPGNESHPDVEEDKAMLEPILKVVEILVSKVEELEERICANENLVVDELFGGIEKLYQSNMRTKSIEGIKGKYGSLFDPHMEALKELAPDEDLYETLHDMIESAKGEEGFDEESSVKSAVDAIAQKIAKVKGVPAQAEVTIETVEEKPKGGGMTGDPLMEKVARQREEAQRKGVY